MVINVLHHVTQRGNARQFILPLDADRMVYRDLLRQYVALHDVSLVGYCLMSNHVHLVATPHSKEGLALALKKTQGRYALYWNARQASSGHAWQGRFYSCPLDEPHLWKALGYVELNPVRAGLVTSAELWPWSSAAAHCGSGEPDTCLEMEAWRKRWDTANWRRYLAAGETEAELKAIRQCTHTGRPLGTSEFVQALEKATLRRLAPQKGGRQAKAAPDQRPADLVFGE